METNENIFPERKVVDSVNTSEEAPYVVALKNEDGDICPLFSVYSKDLAISYAKELGKGCEDGLLREYGYENRAYASSVVLNEATNEVVIEVPMERDLER